MTAAVTADVTDRRPMEGMRVLDLTSNVAGPLACQVLVDLGAEVVKIEPPTGEAGRNIRSTIPGQEDLRPYFLPHHRGKKSVVLDLHDDGDVTRLLALADTADVFVQGFRPGVLDRLGLGADVLRRRNPRLVHASLSAFSGDGDQHLRPGIDALIQAESGLLTGLTRADGAPLLPAPTVVDACSGHVLAQAILAALLARERHGQGDAVEVALYDVAVSMQAPHITRQLHTVPEHAHLTETGRSSMAVAPSGPFRAADGWLMLFAYVPKHWNLLTEVLGRPDLRADPRFADQLERARHPVELAATLETALAAHTVAEWVELLTAAGVMASPVRGWSSVIGSAAFAEAELAVTVEAGGRTELAVRTPARYRGFTPGGVTPTPLLGEHTDDVLGAVRT
ncbi:CoA transferase [Pseudonocardia sulfidoxydans NBRC 16205]|uniref:CoA transferase n=1 Tax=Pseudonocardia sulfidoxydans NBRC 16205 TaxID=1223511 RepID=A0A511DBV8_9PSEU|nr:CoA transferase [Pseudonocardia sulfidoxydans]GEL22286.1 CoA transferase [Pseudonocardia sulfidoxydans NBRC 16205]